MRAQLSHRFTQYRKRTVTHNGTNTMIAKKSTNFENPVKSAVLAAVFTAIPLIGFFVLMLGIAVAILFPKIANKFQSIAAEVDATTKNKVAYELFLKNMMVNIYHIFWAGLTALAMWICFANQDGWLFNPKWSILYVVSCLIIAPPLTFLSCKKIRNG